MGGLPLKAPKRRWVTNLRRIEIEICTGCNLRCPNCDRSSAQAPSAERMTLAQISRFVDESIDLDWRWERITILGGEPTLHPDLVQIFETLKIYKDKFPSAECRLYTNGYGPRVNRVLGQIPEWVVVFNTQKGPVAPTFSAYNLAPLDFEDSVDSDFTNACAITETCGLGLTRYGFYPCGAGASLDRVFGFDIGIKRLGDVTASALGSQTLQLCSRCGHFRDFDDRLQLIRQGSSELPPSWTNEQQTSPTWSAAYARYDAAKPSLTLY
jgi:hypothetical protein